MYPNDKELLSKSVRETISVSDLKNLISEVKVELEDELLILKLRQIRNTFATGGRELFNGADFDYEIIDQKLCPLFDEFIFVNPWKSGVSIILQICANLSEKYKSGLLTRLDKKQTLSIIQKIDIGCNSYLAAFIFNSQRQAETLLFEEEIYSIYLFHFLRNSADGWNVLLFNYLFDHFSSIFVDLIKMENVEQSPTEFLSLIEFLTERLKQIQIDEKSENTFNIEIVNSTREIFFNLCNSLLIGRNDTELPFGQYSVLLFEILSFLSICSARVNISTEPMIVAICGILKRCFEISQQHQKELIPKLTDDGELPKKSQFIELMFSIWKDAVRILGFLHFIFSDSLMEIFENFCQNLGYKSHKDQLFNIAKI